MDELKDRIKYVRKQLRLTQIEFADALGINQANIPLWENGKYAPKRDRLKQIADLAGVSIMWLISGEGSPEGSVQGSKVPLFRSIISYIDNQKAESYMFVYDLSDIDKIAVRCNESSMDNNTNDSICEGDYLILDTKQKPITGDVVVVAYQGRQFVRELKRITDKEITLTAFKAVELILPAKETQIFRVVATQRVKVR